MGVAGEIVVESQQPLTCIDPAVSVERAQEFPLLSSTSRDWPPGKYHEGKSGCSRTCLTDRRTLRAAELSESRRRRASLDEDAQNREGFLGGVDGGRYLEAG